MSQRQLAPRHFPAIASSKNSTPSGPRTCVPNLIRACALCAVSILIGSCESKNSSVVDTIAAPPILTEIALSPSRVNSDTINIGSSRQPDDLLSVNTSIVGLVKNSAQTSASVHFTIMSSDSLTLVSQGPLLDDGIPPDQVKGDGYFSAKALLQFRRVQVGTYLVQVSAESPDGFRSNTIIAPFVVFRGNHPPVISNLVAPDTLRLGNETQLLTLTIRADDPDGLTDVAKVIFNSFKPDGAASGGNPWLMYDDGLANHGDSKASDGTFSLIISLPSTTQPGAYRFVFQAFDRSNEPSNVITLKLVVKP